MFRLSTLSLLAACLAPAPLLANGRHIPEPMLFDLVRPLSAEKGELEANVLGVLPLSGDDPVDWAPEIEYAFANGHAAELELPFEDGALVAVKFGLQGRIGTSAGGRILHGWQYLGVYERAGGDYGQSLLYLLGWRGEGRWSSMTMAGVERTGLTRDAHTAFLLNHSLFHDVADGHVAGLEINYRTGSHGSFVVMPQSHHRMSGKMSVQVGVGMRKERYASVRPAAGLRMIREF